MKPSPRPEVAPMIKMVFIEKVILLGVVMRSLGVAVDAQRLLLREWKDV